MFGEFCFKTITHYTFEAALSQIAGAFFELASVRMWINAVTAVFLVIAGVYEQFLLPNTWGQSQASVDFKW